tara:strand:- start:1236 stop:1916 length:681 start_codon:yes stop_codon:yes gene_type:complete
MAIQNVTTPTGVALYPWLTKPDTKFNEEGEYKVNLVLSKEDAQPLLKVINSVFEENLKEEIKKQKKKDIKTANPPYSEQFDDDGKPTGNLIFKFKSKAAYKPAIFDAQNNPMVDPPVWGGSEIKVNAGLYPYASPLYGAGVSLKIRAVQVIRLVEGSEGASRFGFDKTSGYDSKEGIDDDEQVDAKVFEQKTDDAISEPKVVKNNPTSDGSKDVADILDKWGVKDD